MPVDGEPVHSAVPSIVRVAVTALSTGALAVAMAGTFVPLRTGGHLEYAYLWGGPAASAVFFGAAATVVLILDVLLVRIFRRSDVKEPAQRKAAACLAPLMPLGLLVFGILPAVPGVGERAAPIAYFLHELRWWWIAAAIAGVLLRVSRAQGRPLVPALLTSSRWPEHIRLLLADCFVFLTVVGWAWATSPLLAFNTEVHGDEPKYLRFCETFYEGHGFSFALNVPIDDTPLDAPSALLANAGHFGRALIEESRSLLSDLRRAASDRGFAWNRAEGRPGWFLVGKRGIEYQVHMPGLSFLLMPGYYLDRHFLSADAGYQREFPHELTMTNATLLLLYGLCGVAAFRLLRNALASDALAAGAGIVAMITLPTTSFAFQIYPEIPAALFILVSVNFLLFRSTAAGPFQSFVIGGLGGGLGWLHPRFLLVSAVLLLIAAFMLNRRTLFAFAAAWIGALLTLGAYAYRLTGSWMPTAMYDAYSEGDAFLLRNLPIHVFSNAFDRLWGVLPHAPVLLLALPGLALLARRRLPIAAALALLVAALWIPAAGHGLGAAGATPGRHVLAVLPLMAWPVAELLRRFRGSAAFVTLAAVLLVCSIDAAESYNRWHLKPRGVMVDQDRSGWKPNLDFPVMVEWEGDVPHHAVFAVLILGVGAGAIAAFVVSPARRTASSSALTTVLAVAAAVLGTATGLSAVTGSWVMSDYLMDPAEARLAAATHIVDLPRCQVCFSSSTAAFDAHRLPPTRVVRFTMAATVGDERHATFVLTVEGESSDPLFGRAAIDFGDGRSSGWIGIVGRREVEHEYARAGTFTARARLLAPDRNSWGAERNVEIR